MKSERRIASRRLDIANGSRASLLINNTKTTALGCRTNGKWKLKKSVADDARQHARGGALIACLQGLLAFDHRADEAFVSSGVFAVVKELAVGLG